MKVCILDLETTGLDTDTAMITEIAAARVETETWEIEERVSALVREEDYEPLDKEVVEVTGITDEDLQKYGTKLNVVYLDFSMVMAETKYILAHNKDFDRSILINNLKKRNIDPGLVESKPWICTVSDIPHHRKVTSKKLSHMALDYGVALDPKKLHRALADVELTVDMMRARGISWDEDVKHYETPNVTFVAQIIPPWEDGGVQKAQAQALGFRWNAKDKTWSGVFKQGHIFPDVSFPIKELSNA